MHCEIKMERRPAYQLVSSTSTEVAILQRGDQIVKRKVTSSHGWYTNQSVFRVLTCLNSVQVEFIKYKLHLLIYNCNVSILNIFVFLHVALWVTFKFGVFGVNSQAM